jgi:PAS domain S-box-containing protein
MKEGFLDKLIERLDRLDAGNLQMQFLRLAKEKGLIETIFHSMQEGLVLLDSRGRIEFANRAAERLLGFSMPSAEGIRIGRYLRDVDWESVLSLDAREWSRLLSREIEVSYPEHRFLAFYVMPLQGTDGAKAAAGAVLILRDVTRDRQNEVQSIESERLRAITLLAAGVAHEIGNPLNSLNIHLQLLKREVQRMPESRRKELGDLLDVSAREVTRLDGIITEFLQAVRPVKPKLESVDFPSLLRESLDFQKHELSDRRVLVESEIAAGLPTVRVDRGQIRQVLFNLVKNASEAMPGGGVLRISVAATDRFVRLSVRDTGVGITPEQMSRIFEPYYTTKTRGSGLGMMIVQRIVRDHGGEIEIHSEPQRGTTVTIFLPREDCLIRMLPARGRNAGEDAP